MSAQGGLAVHLVPMCVCLFFSNCLDVTGIFLATLVALHFTHVSHWFGWWVLLLDYCSFEACELVGSQFQTVLQCITPFYLTLSYTILYYSPSRLHRYVFYQLEVAENLIWGINNIAHITHYPLPTLPKSTNIAHVWVYLCPAIYGYLTHYPDPYSYTWIIYLDNL